MKRAVGLSTGVLHKSYFLSQQLVDICRSMPGKAIEIGCIRKKELYALPSLDAHLIRSNFNHLSMHSPTDLKYRNNDETREVMNLMSEAHRRFNFDLVVIHPENVDDWSVFENVSFPVGIENADWRKDFGKTVEDVARVLDKTDFSFVLDVNHCFSNDKSMRLAGELVAHFSDRLREIHLSGFTQYHEPIYITCQEEILRAVPSGECPIVLEGVCLDESEARRELEFVMNYFA